MTTTKPPPDRLAEPLARPAKPPARWTRPAHPRSIAASARGVHTLLGFVIALSTTLLVAAWFLPIMTVRKLIFWHEEISIVDTAAKLLAEGDVFIFLVVVVFSMVFPVVKLGAALFMWLRLDAASGKARRYLGFMQSLGRWSMVDVFVVALSVVAIKVSLISDVEVHAGVYVFSAAIFLSILVMHWLERLIQRSAAAAPKSEDRP